MYTNDEEFEKMKTKEIKCECPKAEDYIVAYHEKQAELLTANMQIEALTQHCIRLKQEINILKDENCDLSHLNDSLHERNKKLAEDNIKLIDEREKANAKAEEYKKLLKQSIKESDK